MIVSDQARLFRKLTKFFFFKRIISYSLRNPSGENKVSTNLELEYEECFGEKPSTKRLNGKVPIEEKKQYLYSLNPARITLLSYASVPSLKEELIYFLRNNKVMVVLDEAHKIKNTSGGVTAAGVLEIAAYCSSRVVLTGTPAPNSIPHTLIPRDQMH